MSTPITKQDTFDTVYRGLAQQGFKRSLETAGEGCRYRGAEGRKCAAGYVLPDEMYHPGMEGFGIERERDLIEGEKPNLPTLAIRNLGHDIDLLVDLQLAHDFADTPNEMRESLLAVAEAHDLTIPVTT